MSVSNGGEAPELYDNGSGMGGGEKTVRVVLTVVLPSSCVCVARDWMMRVVEYLMVNIGEKPRGAVPPAVSTGP